MIIASLTRHETISRAEIGQSLSRVFARQPARCDAARVGLADGYTCSHAAHVTQELDDERHQLPAVSQVKDALHQ